MHLAPVRAEQRRILDLLDLDYETVLVDPSDEGGSKYLEVNPFGKVPTLVHDGRVILESAAQAMYLADLRPEAGLAPPLDDPRRATYYELFVLGPSELEPIVMRALQAPEKPESVQNQQFALELYQSRFVGPYFLGGTLLAIDVFVHWGLRFFNPNLLSEHRNIALYFERMNGQLSWEGY